MTETLYQEPLPITREDAEAAFASGVSDRICDALVRVTFNDSDWRWIQEKCLYFINSTDMEVRGLAVACLGHLARIHGKLDLKRVLPILENLRNNDAEVKGRVEDTFDDIDSFLHK